MTSEFLDTLVKLANLGTSGICVLAIAWGGFQFQKIPNDAPPIRYETLKSFFNLCILIAVISAATGLLSAYFNRQQIVTERNRADTAVAAADTERQHSIAASTEIQALRKQTEQLAVDRKSITERLAAIQKAHPDIYVGIPDSADAPRVQPK